MTATQPVPTLSPEQLAALAAIAGPDHVSARGADLDAHAKDESFHTPVRPAAVVWPASAQEIAAILQLANAARIPVTPWGAGTSLEGNPIPTFGGIVLDLQRMNRILEVRPDDLQADVQPGILYTDMNRQLAHQGLFFAPDPGAHASIGGMVANNASGTRTVKYGATRDNVLRLEVVTAAGEIVHVGTHAAKTSAGLDLLHLFVGSEGTLGVVTEATLRLAPIPEHFSAVVTSFETVAQATQAVASIMGCGITPAALEFLNVATVRVLNTAGMLQFAERPNLLLEFHATARAALEQEMELVHELCAEEGALDFRTGLGRDERDKLWEVRHKAYEIIVRSHPDQANQIVDVCVPVSSYPQMVTRVEEILHERGLEGYAFGHAGDGNVHAVVLYRRDDAADQARASEANAAMVAAALDLHGTCTGEHGVGIGKRRYMDREHGAGLVLMRAVKQALDPNGILNPGKIFD
jgi:D-lactate dehydrogenase (cytochrome)